MASISDETQKILREQMKTCRIPEAHSNVEKDECLLSFDNPFSPNGLYTNLNTWKSFGRDYVLEDSKKTGQILYLNQKFLKVPRAKPDPADATNNNNSSNDAAASDATKLALGVDGGFALEADFEVHKEYNLCILPSFTLIKYDASNEDGYNDKTFPLGIVSCVAGVLENAGMAARQGVQAFSAEEEVTLSRHSSNLVQLDLSQDLRPSPNKNDWKCKNCGQVGNLWFNLSDGYIGCGRKQYGGLDNACGAALQHFIDTGRKYPLAVKLGTITPDGAEIYSYDEDRQVLDKYLAQHLSHWGINIMQQEKYEETTDEMQLKFNKNFAFGMIVESGQKLTNVRGAGLVGLDNLGNTCYMNSMLQGIFSLPKVVKKYYDDAEGILKGFDPNQADTDFVTQMSKLAVGLLSDRYVQQFEANEAGLAEYVKKNEDKYKHGMIKDAKKEKKKEEEKEEEQGIECVAVQPRMLRTLVAVGSQEFSSSRQQDSVEYFRYFLEYLHRSERVSNKINKEIESLKTLFKFEMEERLECAQSKQVRYSRSEDVILKIDIDLGDCKDKKVLEEYLKRVDEKLKKKEAERLHKLGVNSNESNNSSNSSDSTVGTNNNVRFERRDLDSDQREAKRRRLNEKKEAEKKGIEVPKDATDSKAESDEKEVLPEIPLEASLQRFLSEEIVSDWMSPATGKRGNAKKSRALATFPEYLALQVSRYYMTESWTAEKHDCLVPVPQELDISFMRAKGLQQGEVEMAKDSNGSGGGAAKKLEPDETIVVTLVSMGLASENACKRAALGVQNANADMAAAWLFEHMTDPDINDPIESNDANAAAGGGANGAGGSEPDAMKVANMAAMFGFAEKHVRTALIETNGDENRAAEWLFSHEGNLDAETERVNNEMNAKKNEKNEFTDGKGVYEMVAIISHLGKDTGHGHYVSHVKRNGKWYFFNDNKVAESKETPFQHGYLYLFQRKA